MNKTESAKTILKLVVSISVGVVIGNAIKTTTPADINLLTKAAVGVGSLFLTAIASDMAATKMDELADDIVESGRIASELQVHLNKDVI